MARRNDTNRSAASTFKPSSLTGKIEIAARHEIEPLTQGLDWLCGLYAAVNAMRLTAHPLRPLSTHASKQLFHQGVEYLDRKRWLSAAIQHGMSKGRWHRLIRHLAKQAQSFDLHAQAETACLSKSANIDNVFDWIADSLAMGMPVLAQFEGSLKHFSVVVGINDTRLHLFDSLGLQHVLRSSCGIDSGRHRITPGALIRITAKQSA